MTRLTENRRIRSITFDNLLDASENVSNGTHGALTAPSVRGRST